MTDAAVPVMTPRITALEIKPRYSRKFGPITDVLNVATKKAPPKYTTAPPSSSPMMLPTPAVSAASFRTSVKMNREVAPRDLISPSCLLLSFVVIEKTRPINMKTETAMVISASNSKDAKPVVSMRTLVTSPEASINLKLPMVSLIATSTEDAEASGDTLIIIPDASPGTYPGRGSELTA